MNSVIEPLLDPVRVARLLGVGVATLAAWRRREYGPCWFRIGKKVKYAWIDVQAWLSVQASGVPINPPSSDRDRISTGEQLTATLARSVMGWAVGPDRFLKGGRRWAPHWHFQPLRRLENARQLLERTDGKYTLSRAANGRFTASVSIHDRVGTASGRTDAATITVALARAIGIDVPDELLEERKG
jgi:hypothetical protein